MLEKMTLQEAGEALGISPDAVRMRIKRGKMQGEKDETGRWQVWIDTEESEGEQEAEQEPERRSVDEPDLLRQVADAVGITEQAMSEYLLGRRLLKRQELEAIEAYLTEMEEAVCEN